MKPTPPKWADRFLECYCRPELLEEIQGDAHELYYRRIKKSKRKADLFFVWNVIRFFRWKNIQKRRKLNYSTQLTAAMIKNFFTVSTRNFLRQPGHAFLSLFGLTAGFTCAFLILLWVSHEFSFDRFHADTDRIFNVVTHVDANGSIQTYDVAGINLNVSTVPEVASLVTISTGTRWPHELCFRSENRPDECVYFNGIYSNESLFSTFNFPILHGDQNPLKEKANIAISEKMATVLYGDESPIGKTIKIDYSQDVVIAAVYKDIPLNSTIKFDFALPYAVLKKLWGVTDEQFNQNFFSTYIKTSHSVSAAQLSEKLNAVEVLGEEYKNQKITYQAIPFTDWHLKSKFENGKNAGGRIDYIFLFIIIGALVVIMAVINFVNMSTARASLRAKEIGVRKVSGAFRSSLVVQFMTESFLIVFTSFLLAIISTQLALPLFNNLLNEQLSLNLWNNGLPIYLGAFLISVAFLAGIYPALVMSSFQPLRILKGQFLTKTTGSFQLRKVLMVVQLSVSIGILVFCGILFKQINFITNKDLGFDRKNTVRMEPTYKLFMSYDAFKNELLKDSNIESLGTSDLNPLNTGGGNTGVDWPGKPKDLRVSFKTIGCIEGFPETIGLKILEGRTFLPNHQVKDSLYTEVLVTEGAVKTMGLSQPIGEHIKIAETNCEIIGIINDFHTASLHEVLEPVILYRKAIVYTAAVYIKYKPGKAQEAMISISNAYKKIEPSFTMKYWFQDETFDNLYKTEMIASRLVLLFSAVALVIAIIGVVGLATFNIMRKTKEISIRRVFGASVTQVLNLLFSEFAWVLIISFLIAFPLTWYTASNWLDGFAYRTTIPWWIFAGTLGGIIVLILSIIWVQGQKTISANPTKTLRSE